MTNVSQQTKVNNQIYRFLLYVAIVNAIFSGVEFAIAWYLKSWAVAIIGMATATLFAASLIARYWFKRNRLVQAGFIVSLSCQIISLCCVIALPNILPISIQFLMGGLGLPLLFRSQRLFISIMINSVILGGLLIVFVMLPPLFTPPPTWLTQGLVIATTPTANLLLVLYYYYIWQNFNQSLTTSETINTELSDLKNQLEQQVSDRTIALQQALTEVESRAATQDRLLEENRQQREALRNLSVPVLPINATTLVIPLIGNLDDDRLTILQQESLAAITRFHAKRLILDMTGVPFLDQTVAFGIKAVSQSCRLLGAEILIVGINPDVAQTLINLNVGYETLQYASTLASVVEKSS